jgi:H+/gluconate symporter-like permease
MFRTLVYPSSGACDCVDELAYHIGRLVLSSLCVGVLVWLVFGGFRFAGFSLQNEHHQIPAAPKLQHTTN